MECFYYCFFVVMEALQFVKDPLDLANLEIVDPAVVTEFEARVNALGET